jgi:hypothetical protein
METEQYAATLERELATCDELLSIEPDCKQAMLAVVLMLQQLIALHPATHGDSAAQRVVDIFARLRELDPPRVNYYNEMQASKQQLRLP